MSFKSKFRVDFNQPPSPVRRSSRIKLRRRPGTNNQPSTDATTNVAQGYEILAHWRDDRGRRGQNKQLNKSQQIPPLGATVAAHVELEVIPTSAQNYLRAVGAEQLDPEAGDQRQGLLGTVLVCTT